MLKGPANDFEIEMHTRQKDQTEFYSRYEFLKAHYGIRPNCLHGIIGSTGCGKSTLVKCIIAEAAQGHKVLVWLSEENVVEYQELIQYLDKSCLKNISFVEEKDIPDEFKADQNNFFQYFTQMANEAMADIVFIDNVTSSAFYNQRFGFGGQNRSAEFLRNFCKSVCSVFYVSHTGSSITDNHGKVINPEDIRGSNELAIVTEYMYIIQKFTTEDKQFNLVRVAKYRHHEKARGWYALKYSQKAYIGDSKVPFNLVNAIFKSRDYFGKKTVKKTKAEKEAEDKETKQQQRKLELDNE